MFARKALNWLEMHGRSASTPDTGAGKNQYASVRTVIIGHGMCLIFHPPPPPPHIEITTCPELDDPQYGSVNYTYNTPGATAHYKCNKGFKLVGDEYRECIHNGYWSGKEPVCKSEWSCNDVHDNSNSILFWYKQESAAPTWNTLVMERS